MKTILISLAFTLMSSAIYAAPNSAAPRTQEDVLSAESFVEAFKKADVVEMGKSFAKEILFLGEHRFIELKEPMERPAIITKQKMVECYSKFFKKAGEKKWSKFGDSFKVAIDELKNDGDYGGIGKTGDQVLRIKGGPEDLDEAIIFIYRKVGNRFEIVGHYADY